MLQKSTKLSPFSFNSSDVSASIRISCSHESSMLRQSLMVAESRQWRKGLLCRKLIASLRLSILGIPGSRPGGGGGGSLFFGEKLLGFFFCFSIAVEFSKVFVFSSSMNRGRPSFYTHPARVLSWLTAIKRGMLLEVL